MKVAQIGWMDLAGQVAPCWGLSIGGKEVDALGGETRAVVSPRDGAVVAQVAWAGTADTDAAVAAARRAFEHADWARLHPRERGAALRRLARLVERDRAELAVLVALEMGKPVREAYRIELRALIRCLDFYANAADQRSGRVSPSDPGELALVTHEPAGVVAAVVPWNFPLTLAGWKFAPALAAGCSVVVKTSENSPLSMLAVARLAAQAGIPDGVLNVLAGDGATAGRRLGEHPDVDVLTFTGSTAVGRQYLRYSASSNLKRVYLELGGKSPNIILPDAPDLDAAADTAAWAIFFNSGEMCTAGSRLIVHHAIADQVLDRIVARLSDWQPGDPLDPATAIGPLVSEAHLDRVLSYVERAKQEGARIIAGGMRVRDETGGSYLAPTILTDLDDSNVAVREEIFGPVLAVQVADDVDDAVRMAAATPYGLAAAVWTSDLSTAHTIARALRAGTVWVNCYEEGDMGVPFGGVKLSGYGRDKGADAIDEYTDTKTTWIRYR